MSEALIERLTKWMDWNFFSTLVRRGACLFGYANNNYNNNIVTG